MKGEIIMNFSQKLGVFILILITVVFVYTQYFKKSSSPVLSPSREEQIIKENLGEKEEPIKIQNVKIFVLDSTGKIRSVNRECNPNVEKSCFEFAIRELVKAPSKWEKSKGFTSEIPQSTKILSIRESNDSIMIDLSSDFESGGGAESTYVKVKQIIKTANTNTKLPVYLYINGKQANVIGGEGIMIKQPLNERSFDE